MKMLYDTIIARSFSKHEQKKFGYGALVGCFFIAFTFFTLFRPDRHSPLPNLNLRVSIGSGLHILMIKQTSNMVDIVEVAEIMTKKMDPVCNIMERTDFCDLNDKEIHIRIDRNSSSLIVHSNYRERFEKNLPYKIRPYARKSDRTAMKKVMEWSVKSVNSVQGMPRCTKNHTIPAVLFSLGGYAGNHFHDFTDIVVPLYITCRKFNGEVQILITDYKSWWIAKFQSILNSLSKYKPIDIDEGKDVIHCFPRVIIGLKRHQKELSIDPMKHNSLSMRDFKEFLRSSYSLKRKDVMIKRTNGEDNNKPKLLIVARNRTRRFTNIEEISEMGRGTGFEVVVQELDMNLERVAETVNSCDMIMGVHGAGLTNIVFLPEKAVFIQIVPFGGVDWVSRNFFGEPSKKMGIKYLEYKIHINESSLVEEYARDQVVLRDPPAIERQGWEAFRSVYLDKQNVRLDINRFKTHFVKSSGALELLMLNSKYVDILNHINHI